MACAASWTALSDSLQQRPVDVAIVGAGAIGACVALECARAGASVVVLDAGAGWGEGASFANAGWICPSHAGPFASLNDLTNALRWMLKRDSPFGFRPSPALVAVARAAAALHRRSGPRPEGEGGAL